ncbi:c-type cytochrome [Acidicapsa ligni]|uniref:c-type cytochrome n=1 Tax=Acidicapsa ligni TaxID=542300 RepID=UPI0021E06064|nr:cytochrome c [Acidicapsa ligni]
MYSSCLLAWLVIHLFAAFIPSSRPAPLLSDSAHPLLLVSRTSPGDLEIGGELSGLPAGTLRYVRYEDLLKLPQETYTVSDDNNFKGRTEISGIALATLASLFGKSSHSDLIMAICYDKYRSNYPSDYVTTHHPLLVLKINGQERDKWPLSIYDGELGPYLISHPTFTPSFKVLAHKDEAQVPFGVTRLEFRTESVVFGAIRPTGNWSKDSPVWEGYEIARQDCYRCHNMGNEGGKMAERSWLILAAWAATDAPQFQHYIHNPRSVMPAAKMPLHPEYDERTLQALTEYFKTFMPVRSDR